MAEVIETQNQEKRLFHPVLAAQTIAPHITAGQNTFFVVEGIPGGKEAELTGKGLELILSQRERNRTALAKPGRFRSKTDDPDDIPPQESDRFEYIPPQDVMVFIQEKQQAPQNGTVFLGAKRIFPSVHPIIDASALDQSQFHRLLAQVAAYPDKQTMVIAGELPEIVPTFFSVGLNSSQRQVQGLVLSLKDLNGRFTVEKQTQKIKLIPQPKSPQEPKEVVPAVTDDRSKLLETVGRGEADIPLAVKVSRDGFQLLRECLARNNEQSREIIIQYFSSWIDLIGANKSKPVEDYAFNKLVGIISEVNAAIFLESAGWKVKQASQIQDAQEEIDLLIERQNQPDIPVQVKTAKQSQELKVEAELNQGKRGERLLVHIACTDEKIRRAEECVGTVGRLGKAQAASGLASMLWRKENLISWTTRQSVENIKQLIQAKTLKSTP